MFCCYLLGFLIMNIVASKSCQIIGTVYQTVKGQRVNAFTSQQKKIMAVALAVLVSFTAFYAMSNFFVSRLLAYSKRKAHLPYLPDVSPLQKVSFSDSQLAQFVKVLYEQKMADLANQDPQFKTLLDDPVALTQFLTRFSSELSVKVRFELALYCGKELKVLDLSEGLDDIKDQQLAQLTQACPNLEVLNLRFTYISTLNLPTGLKELDLEYCTKLSTQELKKLGAFSNLKKLNLAHLNVESLEWLPSKLTELNLKGCKKISSIELDCLASLEHLEKLDVQGTQMTRLSKLPSKLKELNVNEQHSIPSQEFDHLASLSSLEKLQAARTQIASLDKLPTTLKELNLGNCSNISEEELKKLATFSKLENLNLAGLQMTTLKWLPSHLKKLNLNACSKIVQQEFNHLASCTLLETLELSGTAIAGLDFLPKSLKGLVLNRCQSLLPQEFNHLTSFSLLETLDVSTTSINRLDILPTCLKELNIGATSIITLDALPTGLKKLDLHDCAQLLSPEFNKLASLSNLEIFTGDRTTIVQLDHLPKTLRKISLQDCLCKFEEIKKLVSSCPRLEYLFLLSSSIKTLGIQDLKMTHSVNFCGSNNLRIL